MAAGRELVSRRLLRWMKRRGGATFSELQRYYVENIRGLNYDEREEIIVNDDYLERIVLDTPGPRRYRGYGCTFFYGGSGSLDGRCGLIEKFCRKGTDGKYRVVRPIKPPFTRWSEDDLRERHMRSCHGDGSLCDKYQQRGQSNAAPTQQ